MRTICRILIVLLLVSGCASTRYQEQALATVNEADGRGCEEFAKAEAALAPSYMKGEDLAAMALVPYPGWGLLPLYLGGGVADHATASRRAYDQALHVCLAPAVLEQTFGPNNPRVASSLVHLAERYKAREQYDKAEPLYKRVLAIYQTAPDSDDREVASASEAYAELLRKTGREDEAEQLEAEAETVRAKRSQQTGPPSNGGTDSVGPGGGGDVP